MQIPGIRLARRLTTLSVSAVAVVALLLGLTLVHVLPDLRHPFAETTSQRSSPVVLRSITALSRYEAASGTFQVIVDVQKKSKLLPSLLQGSQTLFVGQGTDIAYVDFSRLQGHDIRVSADRRTVDIILPRPQLEPAVLNVRRSHVFAEQEGLMDRVSAFFNGDATSEQAVYVAAQHRVQTAAAGSTLIADAQRNTTAMLTGMLHGLGFQHVAVTFAAS